MKDITRKLISLAAVCCVAVSAVGCGKSSKSSEVEDDNSIEFYTNSDGNYVAAPFQVVRPDGGKVNFGGQDVYAPDPTKGTDNEPATEVVAVTNANKEPVTEVVTVTEAGGQPVTTDGGAVVTQAVPVTTVVTKNPTIDNYVSNTDMMYLFWMDLDDDVNYKFEGNFAKVTFRIRDNVPERDYPVTVSPDLSTIAGVSLNKSTLVKNGIIRVGGDIEPQDISDEDGLVVYAENKSAKPGETIDYYVGIKNNPGLAAVIIWFSYDANAMEYIEDSAVPAGEFADIAVRTQNGTRSNS